MSKDKKSTSGPQTGQNQNTQTGKQTTQRPVSDTSAKPTLKENKEPKSGGKK